MSQPHRARLPREVPRSNGISLGRIGLWCTIVALVFLLLVLLTYLASSLGSLALLLCAVAAILPLGIVLVGVHLVDRWDPEPRVSLWLALLWGASASVALTLLLQLPALFLTGGATYEVFSAVVSAPILEEGSKGLGVLILFWLFRNHFDGPIDGVVFAMTIGAGFAFTENIMYFGEAFLSGDGLVFTATFFTRGLLSPFAHAMFTACTGVAVGWAISRGRNPVTWGLPGLVAAIGLHALWNLSTFINFTGLYLLVQIPLFAGCIAFIVFLQRRERRITEQRLLEYAAAGWWGPEEVRLLATSSGRKQLRQWARAQGMRQGKAADDLIRSATRLAMTRNRLHAAPDDGSLIQDQAELLQRVLHARDQLFVVVAPAGS